jgi:cell division protein FtsQ
LVGAGLVAGWLALSHSRAFAVREAQIFGTQRLSRLEVLRLAGVGAHSNLLALPVGKMQRRLEAHPWIRSARVVRLLPHTVRIQVEEYRPRLLALAGGRLYYLDRHLRPFAAVQDETPPDLPILTGLGRKQLWQPDEESEALLQQAGELLVKLPTSLGRLSEVHLDAVTGLSLVWEEIPAVVRLGFDDFAPRLERLKRVLADLRRRGELARARLIDLDYPRRVVVRLAKEKA